MAEAVVGTYIFSTPLAHHLSRSFTSYKTAKSPAVILRAIVTKGLYLYINITQPLLQVQVDNVGPELVLNQLAFSRAGFNPRTGNDSFPLLLRKRWYNTDRVHLHASHAGERQYACYLDNDVLFLVIL